MNEPVSIRLFAIMARLLPPSFRREFADELCAAFADQDRGTADGRSRFWFREVGGLLLTALREYRELLIGRRPRRPKRPAEPEFPKRSKEMMASVRKDVTYAFRMMLKTPVVTVIAVISLALGVAANTMIFSLVNSWLLRPLPYPDADRIVMVWENDFTDSDDTDAVSPANFFDWQEQSGSLDQWIAAGFRQANLTGIDQPRQLSVASVTPGFFDLLGSKPILGRTFRADEGGDEDAPVVVLNETLWRNQFGDSPDIVGQSITLDGAGYTVVGVVPETFDFLLGTVSMWIAEDFTDQRHERDTRSLVVTARLSAGVSVSQVQTEMSAIAGRLSELYPETNTDRGVNIETLREQFPGPTDRALISILMGVVFLVLLIACANIASLLLAKTDARQKEIAVRTALGAGKTRLVRQLLTESIVTAAIAGGFGILMSVWAVGLLTTALPPEIPSIYMPSLDLPTLGFALLASLFAGITFGLSPAVHAASGGTRSHLLEGGRGGTSGKKKKRLRGLFVMAEFAMALAVLTGAAALTDLFHSRLAVDAGFNPDRLLSVELMLPEHKYEDDAAVVAFVDAAGRELDELPGSEGWSFMNVLPRTRSIPTSEFTIDGHLTEESEERTTTWLSVSPQYLRTMNIALMGGRDFRTSDRADAPPVVMVNQRFADQFFDGQDLIGRRITIQEQSREIVGVVKNIAQTRLTGLTPRAPSVYFPLAQRPTRSLRLVARAAADPAQLTGAIQNAVWAVDAEQPIAAVQTVDEYIERQLAGPNLMTQILYVVGFLALALAAIGIYGVMAYSVSQQTNEIGIRMALGANPRDVLTRVTKQGLVLAGVGLLMGIPLAAVLTRLINKMGEAASSEGLGTVMTVAVGPMVGVVMVLAGVGVIACYLPARRATKIDPIVALQQE